jgi:DNA invertase Pin-like site-specific DNA recombinase
VGTNIVFGYVRVSTAEQAVNGHGLDMQRARIAAWANYQGLDQPRIFEDAAMSGVREDRPQFRAVLRAALQQGHDAILVCFKLDRLGRDALHVQETLALLIDAGVRVVAVADGLDTGSGMGASVVKLLVSMLSTFADLERDTIRTRLLEGRKRADANDRVYASEPRYGRQVREDESSLVAHAEEQRVIARARELRGEGLSLRAIAAVLDDERFKPRRGYFWNHVVVGRLLTGRAPVKTKGRSSRISRLRADLLGDERGKESTGK